MAKTPVMKVKSAEHAQYGGYKLINVSDFDPTVHEPFVEERKVEEVTAPIVQKRGRKRGGE